MILASTSKIRAEILERSGVEFDVLPARIDEEMLRAGLIAEGATARELSDALADAKARKISAKVNDVLVLGCDQILDCEGEIISKAANKDALLDQLKNLRGKKHKLYSAAVIALNGSPIWRYIGEAQIAMRNFSDEFLIEYVARNFDEVQYCVGGYQIEGQGAQLIEDYRGDYFSILGLPLFAVLGFLRERGELKI